MSYEKINWNDKQKVNITNLSKMDEGIYEANYNVSILNDRLAEYDEALSNVSLTYDPINSAINLSIGTDNTPNVRIVKSLYIPKPIENKTFYFHTINIGQQNGQHHKISFISFYNKPYSLKDLYDLNSKCDLIKLPVSQILLDDSESYSYVVSDSEYHPGETYNFDFDNKHSFSLRLYKNSKNGTTKNISWNEDEYFNQDEFGLFTFEDTVE